jgi:thiol-disulfide isomerase/thioredoxin
LNFDFIENNKTIHCSKKADLIKRIAKNNPFSMDTGTVVISGYIKNARKYDKTDSKIECVFCNEPISGTKSVFTDIDSLGRFSIPIKVLHAASCYAIYRNKLKEIFVSPGDQLFLGWNADDLNELDFMGTHADVCYDILYTNEAYLGIENGAQRNSGYAKDPVEFKKYRNMIKKKQDEYLQNYLNQNSCSDAFKVWRTKNDQNEYYTELMRYTWNRFDKGSVNRMATNDAYFSFIDSIDLNDSLASIPYKYVFFSGELGSKLNARDSVHEYSSWNKHLAKNKKELTTKYPDYTEDQIVVELHKLLVDKQIELILSNKYSRFRDIRLSILFSGYISNRLYDAIDHAYNKTKTEIKFKPYLNLITEHYNDFKKKEEAFKNTPITTMKSSEKGALLLKEILQNHKNRIVVIDFWYTGCGPCRRDFESMKTIKKDLIREDVDFVYLCYSSVESIWKNVIKEFNIQGDHYLLTGDQFSYFSKLLDINSAPRYILINKEGRIVNSNFRPPMESLAYISALHQSLMK